MKTTADATMSHGAEPRRRTPFLRGFDGYGLAGVPPDLLAGLTLAAIAIPEQMATARLAGLPPRLGFYAFIAGSLAYAALGAGRRLSAGADSTITPIFAGALALTAASGAPHFAVLAAGLAMLVGVIVLAAGVLRLGWVGNLLSIPVTNGFLAGIAVHIFASQAPAALGVESLSGALPERLLALAQSIPLAKPVALAISGSVLVVIALAHRLNARLPGPLLALAAATGATVLLDLPRTAGLAVLGSVDGASPSVALPPLALDEITSLTPLAMLVALVVMGQTAATARAFPDGRSRPDIDGDFVALGAGNLLSGLLGSFPVNASPPRTAIVAESGGRSPLAGVVASGLVILVLTTAGAWLAKAPLAALSGVLLFVAARLVRAREVAAIVRASPVEGLLILATAVAIVVLPIAGGVAAGVAFSLLHGVWSNARVHVTPLRRIPGTTVWWPPVPGRPLAAETLPDVAVLGFAAPLTFLNGDTFVREFLAAARPLGGGPGLVILEAAGLVEIDYTGAEALREVVVTCRSAGQIFAVARLESPAAQVAFDKLGLRALIGEDHMFESVAAAINALAPPQTETGFPQPAV